MIRHNIRYKGYDYSQAGFYFVTICCYDYIFKFGSIENASMVLNEFGQIAYDEWVNIPNRYDNVSIDVFQIMPNHIHGIVVIIDDFWVEPVDTPLAGDNVVDTPLAGDNVVVTPFAGESISKSGARPVATLSRVNPVATDFVETKPILGNIIGSYKSIVFNKCLNLFKSRNQQMGKLWQKNYWEHIIRNEKSHYEIGNYIIHNPVNWSKDEYNK
jgi:REP element-mobilizing transposase RayT